MYYIKKFFDKGLPIILSNLVFLHTITHEFEENNDYFWDFFDYENSFFIYEMENDELVSYTMLLLYNDKYKEFFSFNSSKNHYNIRCFNVLEKSQNKGKGKDLCKFIIKTFFNEKTDIYLEVQDRNLIARKCYNHFFRNYNNKETKEYYKNLSRLEEKRLIEENENSKNAKINFMKISTKLLQK